MFLLSAIDPRVLNVIGFDPVSSKIYGLGLTTADVDVYMELDGPRNVRMISKDDWVSVRDAGGLTLPTIIPLVPVHGDPMDKLSETAVTVDSVTYVGKLM